MNFIVDVWVALWHGVARMGWGGGGKKLWLGHPRSSHDVHIMAMPH